jgi:hypothetical protein
VNTVVASPNGGPPRAGIAWFVVEPKVGKDGGLDAKLKKQGYVAVDRNNVVFPSIGVTDDGKAVMAASLIGPDYFPSAVYVPLAANDNGKGNDPGSVVHVAAAGAEPDDGFTGYRWWADASETNPAAIEPARWGDYSAAVATPDGAIWTATEYIPGGIPRWTVRNGHLLLFPSLFGNWGTYVTRIQP